MKKKSQIRKYTVQKISGLVQSQQNPQILQLYIDHVRDKINPLLDKKKQLTHELNQSRQKSEAIIRQMNDSFRNRIQKTQTIIMTANSRPSKDDVQSLASLFAYMENQDDKITVNNQDIDETYNKIKQTADLSTIPSFSYDQLDKKYKDLNQKCSQEIKIKQELEKTLKKNRQFYKKIDESIQKCREQYQIVESKIRQQEKQLDNLKTYFNLRLRQDSENIQRENAITDFLEAELLNAQSIVNFNENKDQKLRIIAIQSQKNCKQ